ncbi:MAG: ribosomal-processing cysteine protease Prp [Oscillospiraceae bacterium]
MIKAEFYLKDEILVGFSVEGHAGFADFGLDVVCASVTSAVELTANAITEIVGHKASVLVLENKVRLNLIKQDSRSTDFIKALRLHLELLSNDYSEFLCVKDISI